MKTFLRILNIPVQFLRETFEHLWDDITNLLLGMVITAFLMTIIYAVVAYQDQIVYWLVERALAANNTLTYAQVAGVLAAVLFFFFALCISLMFAIAGFKDDTGDNAERVDNLLDQIDVSGLDETTATRLLEVLKTKQA
jgi:hypothetical protein